MSVQGKIFLVQAEGWPKTMKMSSESFLHPEKIRVGRIIKFADLSFKGSQWLAERVLPQLLHGKVKVTAISDTPKKESVVKVIHVGQQIQFAVPIRSESPSQSTATDLPSQATDRTDPRSPSPSTFGYCEEKE